MIHQPAATGTRMAPPSIGLYIHFPWCQRKCPYCDFNSHQRPTEFPEEIYIDALLWDLERAIVETSPTRIETIFMGGGTPSLFAPHLIERLLEGIRKRAEVSPSAEITLEANPGSVDQDKFKGYRAAGINRLSLGIQSFQDPFLKALGRIHTGQEALRAAESALASGFSEINLDLMFALPGQTPELALKDVQLALAIGPSHLSYYHLTLEPNTFFFKYPPQIPDAERAFEIQETGQAALASGGFQQYEISAYARPGSRCQHNLNYWTFGDYLGIGAGAHGKWTDERSTRIQRSTRIRHPDHYLQRFKTKASVSEIKWVSPNEIPFEFLMNALRMKQGFTVDHFELRTGQSIRVLEPTLTRLKAEGLLVLEEHHIRCSERGFNFLDSVLQAFLP